MKSPVLIPSNGRTRKPIHCIILQLARLGDTVQSLMAIKAAKQLYPELKVSLVVRERFADAALAVDWLDEVFILPTKELIGPAFSDDTPVENLIPLCAQWLSPIAKKPWDLLLNWTFTEASSFLATLIPSKVKLGYLQSNDFTLSASDGWSQYMQAILQAGLHQNIHLTDILTTQLLTALQIHHGEPEPNGSLPVTSKHFFSKDAETSSQPRKSFDYSRRWIAIQLGASHPSKTWPIHHWSKFLNRFLSEFPNHHIVLLGGRSESDLAREVLSHLKESDAPTERILSTVGETNFELWTHSIAQAEWLISGDTAAIHIASVLGTRVFNLSMGLTRYNDTGPYGNGHFIIRSNVPCRACEAKSLKEDHDCRETLDPICVLSAFFYASSSWHQKKTITFDQALDRFSGSELKNRTTLYRSRIRPSEEGGGVSYEALTKSPLTVEQWVALATGHMARAWYCGWTPPIGLEVTREKLHSNLVQSLRKLSESIQVGLKILNEAVACSTAFEQLCRGLKNNPVMTLDDRQAISNKAVKLQELDGLLDRLCQTEPSLQVFSNMSKVLMHNLNGHKLHEVSQNALASYKQLKDGLEIFSEWAHSSLRMVRPVMVKTARHDDALPLS